MACWGLDMGRTWIGLMLCVAALSSRVFALTPQILPEPRSANGQAHFSHFLATAPVLDVAAPGFRSDQAIDWHNTIRKRVLHSTQLSSPAIRALTRWYYERSIQPGLSLSQFALDSLDKLEKLQPMSADDAFVKEFLVGYSLDIKQIAEVFIQLAILETTLQQSLQTMESHDFAQLPRKQLEPLATMLKDQEETLRRIIYKPSLSTGDVDLRLSLWESVSRIFTSAQAALATETGN